MISVDEQVCRLWDQGRSFRLVIISGRRGTSSGIGTRLYISHNLYLLAGQVRTCAARGMGRSPVSRTRADDDHRQPSFCLPGYFSQVRNTATRERNELVNSTRCVSDCCIERMCWAISLVIRAFSSTELTTS